MKSKTTAALLALFLGSLGIHKFYLDKTTQGVLYLLFCWTFIPAILALIDFVRLLVMSDEDFNTQYNTSVPNQHIVTISITPNPADGALYVLKGIFETLYVYEDRVVLDRDKGEHHQMLLGEGGQITFPIRYIRSIAFKEATWAINGTITFRTMGGVEKVVSNADTTKRGSKSITFRNNVNETAKQVVAYLEERINNRGTQRKAPSAADELLKFKKLLDQGAITQEEYDAKKAQLLNG